MNSAYLAIPVNTYLWGTTGTNYSVMYNLVVTLVNFTIGVWWVSPRRSLKTILEIPVVYAVLAGVILNWLAVKPVPLVLRSESIVSDITLPLMLIFVGYRLDSARTVAFGKVAAGVLLRMAGGLAAGSAAVLVLHLTGPAAGVCLLTSSMPAAVLSYVLAERFNADAGFAAATVFAGTCVAFASIPLISYFITR